MSLKKKKGPRQTNRVGSSNPSGHQRPPPSRPYSVELRRKAVRLHLEEGLTLRLVSEETGVSRDTICYWVQRYRKLGEAGLEVHPGRRGLSKPKLPPAVHEAILTVKRENPAFGVRRIAQWLHRSLFLPTSAETVRQTLHRQAAPPAKMRKKPKRNPPKPRFFERATPNQMWQSDIFCFQVNNHNAYLIGFIDDHSRFIVSLGVYRGQTAENVLEVYRRGVGQYGAPKEMLTDNGRQYASWQGKTHFQHALARDRVHHIRSAPHHPMTLGKIERFWKTIWTEFLSQARFETFESAAERIAWWVQYYNYKRPHQGIEGLFPADRFFAVQKEVRQVMEKNIAENVKQMAMHGKPQTPLYVVGNVGGQSVVLHAERGQVKIMVDGKETGGYNDEQQHEGTQGTDGTQCTGEMPGRAGDLDRTAAPGGNLQGTGDPGESALLLAGTGHGGYATGAGATHPETGGPGADACPADGKTPGPEDGSTGESDRSTGDAPGASGSRKTGGLIPAPPGRHGDEEGTHTDAGNHHPGAGRSADGDRSSRPPGDLPEDLLSVGIPGADRDAGGAATGPTGTPTGRTEPGDGEDRRGTRPVETSVQGPGATGADPSGVGRD